MEYKLLVGEKECSVEVTPPNADGLRIVTRGRHWSADVAITAISSNHYHLVVDGCGVNLFVAMDQDGTWVSVEGRARLGVRIEGRPRLARDADKSNAGRLALRGAGPGRLLRLLLRKSWRSWWKSGRKWHEGQPVVGGIGHEDGDDISLRPIRGNGEPVSMRNRATGCKRGKILVEIEPITGGSTR